MQLLQNSNPVLDSATRAIIIIIIIALVGNTFMKGCNPKIIHGDVKVELDAIVERNLNKKLRHWGGGVSDPRCMHGFLACFSLGFIESAKNKPVERA